MKKKFIVALTAFAFFTTLFSFTACSKDKVNIKKGMKPEKVFEMLANAKITSLTVEGKRGEEVTRQTITTEGYTMTKQEEKTTASMRKSMTENENIP